MEKRDGQDDNRSQPGNHSPVANDSKKGRIRGLTLLGLLSVVALLCVAGWMVFGPDGIRPGMTRAEVEGRLGKPNGRMTEIGGTPIKDVTFVWKDRGLVVMFDENDRVREVQRPPSLIGSLRSMFGI
jgi:hypothetical protein